MVLPLVSPRNGDLKGDSKLDDDESERRTAVVDMAAAATLDVVAVDGVAIRATAGRSECVIGAIAVVMRWEVAEGKERRAARSQLALLRPRSWQTPASSSTSLVS